MASNQQGPMSLRVNLNQTTVADYQKLLQQNHIESERHPLAESALILEQPLAVNQLPHFSDGTVSVQDTSAQMASHLLQLNDLKNNKSVRILDACSAPGGKTGHILESLASSQLSDVVCVALDKDKNRLQRVQQNLQRLKLKATLKDVDAAKTDAWYDGKPFDRILIDAPCSGTGVIRRHPDIKLLRRRADIDKLVQIQRHLLSQLWPLLKPGGLLLYATCSIFKIENEQQILWFLSHNTDAELLPIPFEKPLKGRIGWQISPGWQGMDGFFYAPLHKSKA